jgi:hypothetical protein
VAVSLPYTGGAFSALALLPEPGTDVAAALHDWSSSPQVNVNDVRCPVACEGAANVEAQVATGTTCAGTDAPRLRPLPQLNFKVTASRAFH